MLENSVGRALFFADHLQLLSGWQGGRQEVPRGGASADIWQRIARALQFRGAGEVEVEWAPSHSEDIAGPARDPRKAFLMTGNACADAGAGEAARIPWQRAL
eukprot:8826123-Pyramimonas_sp.AAC.1